MAKEDNLGACFSVSLLQTSVSQKIGGGRIRLSVRPRGGIRSSLAPLDHKPPKEKPRFALRFCEVQVGFFPLEGVLRRPSGDCRPPVKFPLPSFAVEFLSYR